MIYVWDNQEPYSAHAVYFFDTTSEKWPIIESILKKFSYSDDGSLVFTAPEVEWYDGATAETAGHIVGPSHFFHARKFRKAGKYTYTYNGIADQWSGIDPRGEEIDRLTKDEATMLLDCYEQPGYTSDGEVLTFIAAFRAECEERNLV